MAEHASQLYARNVMSLLELMTGENHGLRLLGGLLVIGPADGFLEDVLVVIAIAFGTINVVGGFLVTDRMLGMFKSKPEPPKELPEE